jgi:Arc/MetJ-type ribon-helix-helix transcriptional regulator
MLKPAKSPRGRPAGSGDYGVLITARIPLEMAEILDGLADARMDRPSQSQMIREALALYIERQRQLGQHFTLTNG